MLRLALHGGLYSGKSTLASALRERGFAYVNYTDMLKELVVVALNAIGVEVTIEQLRAEKAKFRNYIIETGIICGFDDGYLIPEILAKLATMPDQAVVWDNVRFPAQMDLLLPHGYRLVRLTTPLAIRQARAKAKGVSAAEFRAALKKPTEKPLPVYPGEVSISVDGDMDAVIQELTVRLLQGQATAVAAAAVPRAGYLPLVGQHQS